MSITWWPISTIVWNAFGKSNGIDCTKQEQLNDYGWWPSSDPILTQIELLATFFVCI
jgi:hypothetical protein